MGLFGLVLFAVQAHALCKKSYQSNLMLFGLTYIKQLATILVILQSAFKNLEKHPCLWFFGPKMAIEFFEGRECFYGNSSKCKITQLNRKILHQKHLRKLQNSNYSRSQSTWALNINFIPIKFCLCRILNFGGI